MLTNSYKTKQFFFFLIKISIVVAAFFFIYHKLSNNTTITTTDFINILTTKNILSLENSLFLLILSTCNWFLETLKWKTLISPVKKISFNEALEQSLGALTASLFTPNRIGEYGAKAIYYNSNLRKRVLCINLISNLLQMFITVCLGWIGLSFYLSKYKQDTINQTNLWLFILAFLAVITVVFFAIYKGRFSIKGYSLEKIKQFIVDYPKNKLFTGLLYSFLRYVIFSFQFFLLLHLFQVNISYFDAMTVITSMYLIASVIPSIFIFDVVIKGSVSVYLFSFLGVNELSILSITSMMWLLNFVLPSILGSYFVLNFKLIKNTETQ